jgi:hypothetical protein
MVEVESKHASPLAECAHCGHMLPQGLGEIECEICTATNKVSHQPTNDALNDETVPCPHCNMILVAGTDERPIDLTCGGCEGVFTVTPKIVKVEIACPGCERNLRIRPRPGQRELKCPACEAAFNVTF